MRWSELKGRKIVSTSTAGTVGKVSGIVVDPATRSIVALKVKKSESGSVVHWPDLTAVGHDAVTVGDAATITEPSDEVGGLSGKGHRLFKKRVLDTDGDNLGKVKDLDFDAESGVVVTLILGDQEIRGERLIGIGSYAVVVRSAR